LGKNISFLEEKNVYTFRAAVINDNTSNDLRGLSMDKIPKKGDEKIKGETHIFLVSNTLFFVANLHINVS